MRSNLKVFLGLSVLICFTGALALVLIDEPESTLLPRLPSKSAPPALPAKTPVPRGDLLAPWAKESRIVNPAAPVPVFPKPTEPVPDRTSVRFLGTLTGDGDVKTILFKLATSNKPLMLIEGQESQGWTLTKVTPQLFILKGPGGVYEVPR